MSSVNLLLLAQFPWSASITTTRRSCTEDLLLQLRLSFRRGRYFSRKRLRCFRVEGRCTYRDTLKERKTTEKCWQSVTLSRSRKVGCSAAVFRSASIRRPFESFPEASACRPVWIGHRSENYCQSLYCSSRLSSLAEQSSSLHCFPSWGEWYHFPYRLYELNRWFAQRRPSAAWTLCGVVFELRAISAELPRNVVKNTERSMTFSSVCYLISFLYYDIPPSQLSYTLTSSQVSFECTLCDKHIVCARSFI